MTNEQVDRSLVVQGLTVLPCDILAHKYALAFQLVMSPEIEAMRPVYLPFLRCIYAVGRYRFGEEWDEQLAVILPPTQVRRIA